MGQLAVVFCGRDLKVHPTLIAWLLHSGFAWDDILFHRGSMRDNAIDYNHGIVKALESKADSFVFSDCDVEPTIRGTGPFWDSPLDIVCAKCPTECGERSWVGTDAFHSALWRMSRDVIVKMGLPLFRWPTTPDGSMMLGCLCSEMAYKAKKLGFSIGHAGEAGHTPRSVGESRSLHIII